MQARARSLERPTNKGRTWRPSVGLDTSTCDALAHRRGQASPTGPRNSAVARLRSRGVQAKHQLRQLRGVRQRSCVSTFECTGESGLGTRGYLGAWIPTGFSAGEQPRARGGCQPPPLLLGSRGPSCWGAAFISQVPRGRQARRGDSCDSEGSGRIWKVLGGLGELLTLPVTDHVASGLKNLPGA